MAFEARLKAHTSFAVVDSIDSTTMCSLQTRLKSLGVKLSLALRGRRLSEGEISLVRSVFQDSIDPSRIRILRRSYVPLFVTASMSPNGNIYFPPSAYEDDFASASLAARCHFVHEMTHVWQHQMRYRLRWNGLKTLLTGGYWRARIYRYDQKRAHPFARYNFEQQAELIAHYYRSREQSCPNPILEAAVTEFLSNPTNRDLLPRKPRLTPHQT
jgi:hypothetical protein